MKEKPIKAYARRHDRCGAAAGIAQDLKLLADVDSLGPARSALAGLCFQPNSFRHFPTGSSVADVPACSRSTRDLSEFIGVVGMQSFQLASEGAGLGGCEGIGGASVLASRLVSSLASPAAGQRMALLSQPPHDIQHVQPRIWTGISFSGLK